MFGLFKKKRKKKVISLPRGFEIDSILNNIRDHRSYYAGGTLCVDKILPEGDVLIFNLDGTYSAFCEDGPSENLSKEQTVKLFEIYKEIKGETEYYKEKLKNL